jgi:hypothetical protein
MARHRARFETLAATRAALERVVDECPQVFEQRFRFWVHLKNIK